jgi:hypothetical protein
MISYGTTPSRSSVQFIACCCQLTDSEPPSELMNNDLVCSVMMPRSIMSFIAHTIDVRPKLAPVLMLGSTSIIFSIWPGTSSACRAHLYENLLEFARLMRDSNGR